MYGRRLGVRRPHYGFTKRSRSIRVVLGCSDPQVAMLLTDTISSYRVEVEAEAPPLLAVSRTSMELASWAAETDAALAVLLHESGLARTSLIRSYVPMSALFAR